jgi:hypothetical protein
VNELGFEYSLVESLLDGRFGLEAALRSAGAGKLGVVLQNCVIPLDGYGSWGICGTSLMLICWCALPRTDCLPLAT